MLPQIIAIEGIDGAGKATQASLLAVAARLHGQNPHIFSFPDYTTKTGKWIASYLRGEAKADPLLVAAAYSLNRAEKQRRIADALDDPNSVVIFDRYASSNIHNIAKFVENGQGTVEEAEEFMYHVEYELCLNWRVKGESNILLDIPSPSAQILTKSPRAYIDTSSTVKPDLHEGDPAHLSLASQIYRFIAQRDSWTVIDCTEEGRMRTPASISAELVERVKINDLAPFPRHLHLT